MGRMDRDDILVMFFCSLIIITIQEKKKLIVNESLNCVNFISYKVPIHN